MQGINMKARAKVQCINNIERCLQVLFSKNLPVRFIPTADEIFESEKNAGKIWLLLKLIFEQFTMTDVYRLAPYTLKWLCLCLEYAGV